MKKIFDTDYYYEAYSDVEDACIAGSYSELIKKGFGENEIEWSHHLYEDELSYFFEFLNECINEYEKRYKTAIKHVAMAGHVGRWNGSPIGGRILSVDENPILHMGDVDKIEVRVDDDGVITLYGYHHDGTHKMNLYLLSENKLKRVMPDYLYY